MKTDKIYIVCLLLATIFAQPLFSQNVVENEEADLKEFDMNSFSDAGVKIKDSTVLYQHLVGVKWGYSISGVTFSQSNKHKTVKSPKNFGIYYTYLHSMLGTMPYFGMQVGIATTQVGYKHINEISEEEFTETEHVYSAIELPLVALFRGDIGKIRLSLGIGGYCSYIYDTDFEEGIPETTNKGSFGIMGQGGIAIKLHPLELHFEASYKYGLTNFFDPKMYSEDNWIYTHPNQFQISVGLHYNLGGKYYRRK